MSIRVLLLASTLLLPFAWAGSNSWSDPAGDEMTTLVSSALVAPGSFACHNGRVDLVGFSTSTSATTVTLTMSFANLDDTPGCTLPGGQVLDANPNHEDKWIHLSDPARGAWIDVYAQFGYCGIQGNLMNDLYLDGAPCTLSRSGHDLVIALGRDAWAYDFSTETMTSFDLATLDFPHGSVHATEQAHVRNHALVTFTDGMTLGAVSFA